MRKRVAILIAGLVVTASALSMGWVADAAPLHPAYHGVIHGDLGVAANPTCTLASQKTNSSTPYGSGHLNVYLDYYRCVTNTGLDLIKYELYVDTSNGDLFLDNTNSESLRVRVWLYGKYEGTTYGPAQNGDFSYASDTTGTYGQIPGSWWPPQADDIDSYVLTESGTKVNLPYLNF